DVESRGRGPECSCSCRRLTARIEGMGRPRWPPPRSKAPSPMAKRRIFVSATSRDLGSYRDLASKTLRKRGYDPDDQAIFNLTYLEIHEKLKQRIEQCDAVVCLIGFVYGGEPSKRPPNQPRHSFTQWEYFIARDLKKPVYLLLADEKTPFDPHEPESQTKQ